MKATLNLRGQQATLCPYPRCAQGCEVIEAARDPYFSGLWIFQMRDNAPKLAVVRRMIEQLLGGAHVHGMSDDDLLNQVAQMLRTRELHIHGQGAPKRESTGAGSQGASARNDPFSARFFERPKPRATEVVRKSSSTEPSFLNGNADARAIAKVLKAAAQSGKPFCEECEKARNA
jgi:hypothetical protein